MELDRYGAGKIGMDILNLSREVLRTLKTNLSSRNLISAVAQKEVVTTADLAIEDFVIRYLKAENLPFNLDGEERRRTKITDNPAGLIVLDPLDGTYNYFRGANLKLPYCTIVSVFNSPQPSTLGEAAWAGIFEHVSGYMISTDDSQTANKTSGRISLEGEINANIMLDLGPSRSLRDYEPFADIIRNSWTKNVSCAGFHLAGVASGTFDAYICPVQKPEELVAGIPLIEKAGGAVITFDGKRTAELDYDFDARYRIIAAATEELAKEISGKINR